MTQYGVAAGMPGDMSDANLPILTLDATTLRAEPGGQAQATLTLKNPGQLVESFRLDVVGLDAGWWQVHPPELALYPGEDSTAVVVLTPPAQARAPEQPLPFGVRAISTLDSQRGVVEEGDLEVGRVFDLQGTIAPVTSRARWSARHTVTYTNWGNSPVRLKLTASDKDGRVGFQLSPESLAVPVGGSATAKLRVRPRDPFLRGSPVHLPFQVRGEQPGAAPAGPRSVAARAGVPDPTQPVLDAAVQQVPILTKGVIVVLMAAILAAGAAVALLFKSGDVAGAQNGDVAPEPPTSVTAVAATGEVVTLTWVAPARATDFSVQILEGKRPVKAEPVKGVVESFDVPGLKPNTEYCFNVFALRGTLPSAAPPTPACTTTRTNSLDPPTNVKVTPGGDAFRVTWKGDKTQRFTVLVDGSPASPNPTVGPGVLANSITIPAGDEQKCVTVVAVGEDNKASDPSDPPQCVTGVGPSPTPSAGNGTGPGPVPVPVPSGGGEPSATASGSGAPNLTGVVAVIGPPYQSDDGVALPARDALRAQGVPAEVLPAAQIPNAPASQGAGPKTVFVVVRGFADEAAAQDFCDTKLPPDASPPCVPVRVGT